MKRFLSLFIAIILCFSSFTALAVDEVAEEVIVIDEAIEEVVDYADMSNWAYWNEGNEKTADLFFVCPTVDMGKGGNFNADINSEKYRESFVGAINMELGIYNDDASVYAPYYRQATFPVYNLDKEEYINSLSEIKNGDLIMNIISQARGEKTNNNVSLKTPIKNLNLSLNEELLTICNCCPCCCHRSRGS